MIKRPIVKAGNAVKVKGALVAAKRNPPLVVHIGNVGLSFPGEVECAKTKKYSARFPGINFVGIDLRGASPTQRNWKQIKGDAIFGLKSLKDNSVSILRSEMALGYYTSTIIAKTKIEQALPSADYAKRVLEIAFKKLKPNGKVVIVADVNVVDSLKHLGKELGFSKTSTEYVKNESTTSYWTKRYDKDDKINQDRTGYMVELTFFK